MTLVRMEIGPSGTSTPINIAHDLCSVIADLPTVYFFNRCVYFLIVHSPFLVSFFIQSTGLKYEDAARFTCCTAQLERSGFEAANAGRIHLLTCFHSSTVFPGRVSPSSTVNSYTVCLYSLKNLVWSNFSNFLLNSLLAKRQDD